MPIALALENSLSVKNPTQQDNDCRALQLAEASVLIGVDSARLDDASNVTSVTSSSVATPSENVINQKRQNSIGSGQMITAYILAKVESGKDAEVLARTKEIPGVKQAVPTYGVYDLHVEVSFDMMEELDRFIFDKIRKIPGVKETVTLVAFRGT